MKIPGLIVSGFLGSGKTTLVGRLLADAQSKRIRLAIVSNEFGETGIDRALLDAGEDGFAELDGGCVCCRLSDAFGETVAELAKKTSPQRLVVETSGVALPGELVIQFWRPPVSDIVEAVRIVVVVDADRLSRVDVDETMVEQLEAADVILLNKCDLVDEPGLQSCEAWLRERVTVPIHRCVRGEVDLDALWPATVEPAPEADHEPHEHDHLRYDSFPRSFPGVVEPDALIAMLRAEDALRCKGFVRTPAGVRTVQGVGDRIELSEPTVPVREDLIGTVVVIRRA